MSGKGVVCIVYLMFNLLIFNFMKTILFAVVFILSVFNGFGEDENPRKKRTDAHVTGHVVNKETKEHIPFLSVLIKGTTIGTATDETGHYVLRNLPEGKHVLRVQGVGYRSVEREVVLKKGETLEVNFEVEEDVIMLDGTIVTANRNETDRREAPVIVGVLAPQVFESANAVCLAQGLSFQPGLRVENNCQNCGFQQVRINGLEGPYTQLLIDSRPICSSLANVYGLEQIPVNMIERVEVMRGGGSALFGSNAIAGTINIITKEPLNNFFNAGHTFTVIGGKNFDNATSFGGAIVGSERNAGIHLFGIVRDRQGYDHDGDGYTELAKLSSSALGFRSYYKPTQLSKLILEYHHINEFRRGGNKLDMLPHEADIAEQTEHNIHGGGLDYILFSKDYERNLNVYFSMQDIKRESYYGAGQNPDAYGKTADLTLNGGLQFVQQFDRFIFMPSELTAGVEFSYNELHDRMLGLREEIRQDISVYSLFLQNEWKTGKLSLLLGGRLDKNSVLSKPIFSPRVNVRYNPMEDLSFRASYSEGFRAPQTYDEDLHVGAVGGEMTVIQVADDLKTERSHSYSVSADYYVRWGKVQMNWLLEGFYTDLRNVFVLEPKGKNDKGHDIMERTNGPGAKVKGINVEGRVVPHASLQVQLGATFQSSRYKEAQAWSKDPTVEATRKILRSPDRYGYITLGYNPFKDFTASFSGTYTGPMQVGHVLEGYGKKDELVTTPSFFDGTLKLSYDVKFGNGYTFQVNGGVQNVFDSYQSDFDQGEARDSKYIYGPILPRSYFVGVKFGIF